MTQERTKRTLGNIEEEPLWEKIDAKIGRARSLARHGIRPKRAVNYLAVKAGQFTKPSKVLGRPVFALIEVTAHCNLKCPLCPTGAETLGREKGHMSMETFERVVQELGPYLMTINLTNYGEPYINRDIHKMVRLARDADIEVMIGSNGTLLHQNGGADAIIDSGLDFLYVSLDGTDQETYQKYRVNGKLDKVLGNLQDLMDAKRRRRAKTPFVELQFIVMKHNEHQLDEVRRIAHEIGVDRLSLKPVSFNNADWDKPEVVADFRNNYIPTLPEFQLFNKTENDSVEWKVPIMNKCPYVWYGTIVLWDGVVTTCCVDPRGDLAMGNLNDKPLMEIWNSKKYQAHRHTIVTDKVSIPICANCPGI